MEERRMNVYLKGSLGQQVPIVVSNDTSAHDKFNIPVNHCSVVYKGVQLGNRSTCESLGITEGETFEVSLCRGPKSAPPSSPIRIGPIVDTNRVQTHQNNQPQPQDISLRTLECHELLTVAMQESSKDDALYSMILNALLSKVEQHLADDGKALVSSNMDTRYRLPMAGGDIVKRKHRGRPVGKSSSANVDIVQVTNYLVETVLSLKCGKARDAKRVVELEDQIQQLSRKVTTLEFDVESQQKKDTAFRMEALAIADDYMIQENTISKLESVISHLRLENSKLKEDIESGGSKGEEISIEEQDVRSQKLKNSSASYKNARINWLKLGGSALKTSATSKRRESQLLLKIALQAKRQRLLDETDALIAKYPTDDTITAFTKVVHEANRGILKISAEEAEQSSLLSVLNSMLKILSGGDKTFDEMKTSAASKYMEMGTQTEAMSHHVEMQAKGKKKDKKLINKSAKENVWELEIFSGQHGWQQVRSVVLEIKKANEAEAAIKDGWPKKVTYQTVFDIYREKIEADEVDDRERNQRQYLHEFMYDVFLRNYGLKQLAEKKLVDFLCGLLNLTKQPQQGTKAVRFLKLVGILMDTPHDCSPFMIHLYMQFMIPFEFATLTSNSSDGPCVPLRQAVQIIKSFNDDQLKDRQASIQEALTKASIKKKESKEALINFDDYMEICMAELAVRAAQRREVYRNAILAFDMSGDSVLNINEFNELMKHFDPKVSHRFSNKLFREALELSEELWKSTSKQKDNNAISPDAVVYLCEHYNILPLGATPLFVYKSAVAPVDGVSSVVTDDALQ